MTDLKVKAILDQIKRKNIALVYSFQNEDAIGFGHYDFWKFDVVSDWCKAVEQLGCIPYILDVRTFGHKALCDTLPPVDFIINLSAGNQSLSTLGLVPSIAGFMGIPCIPNNVLATVCGESKILSNQLAIAQGISVPRVLDCNEKGGILRPDNYGSSSKVSVQKSGIKNRSMLYQEFVRGADLTIPLLYDASTNKLEVIKGIVYLPENRSLSWFLGEKEKANHQGYEKKAAEIHQDVADTFSKLASILQIKTFCRVDTRLKCNSYKELIKIIESPIKMEYLEFIEINPMPTIRENINFCDAVSELDPNSSLGKIRHACKHYIPDMLETTFVLYSAISAHMNTSKN